MVTVTGHSKKEVVLVVGGLGYIGSHMALSLKAQGYTVVILDDLSKGHRLVALAEFPCVIGSLGDAILLEKIFQEYGITAVMHFAALIEVGESVIDPARYYHNNVSNTLVLLDVMRKFKVDQFVFSSTAAIFGEPQYLPIDERHPSAPVNPYGRSKWMIEQVLLDYCRAYDLRSVCFRYFNAAGADPLGRTGEWHEPESHLIPIVLQVASGKRSSMKIYGRDYDTPDGTCIRDYVHVMDLCSAHILGLQALSKGLRYEVYNLGNGEGFSVKQVIQAAQEVTQRIIAVEESNRRAGDPACLVADSRKAKTELLWKPQYAELSMIIQHAWQWEQRSL